MSDRDHIRRLITLVENNQKNEHKKLLVELADVSALLRRAKSQWGELVMNAWREFGEGDFVRPKQAAFPRYIRRLEARLARQLRSLELFLEEMHSKLTNLENTVEQLKFNKSSMTNRNQFNQFFDEMNYSATNIKRSIEVLEEEGYYHQHHLESPHFFEPWLVHGEITRINSELMVMNDVCYSIKTKYVEWSSIQPL